MISVRNIKKNYENLTVLDGLSIDFPKGKLTSLIGGNGAGKSTLLGIVSKLAEQDSGKVFIAQEDIKHIAHKKFATKVSFLKQSNFTHIRLQVDELVSFGRFPYTRGKPLKDKDKAIVERAITSMDLKAIAQKYLDELSGGQRQRAYLAMILAQDTDYILLDEPLNNLDMKYSVQIMKTLKAFAHQYNKTVILIVHDINIAAHYSDYIATVKNGIVKHFGKTQEVIKPQILKDIFEIDFEVIQNRGCPMCLYFS